MSTETSKTDWLNLPPGVEAESLWCSLHDGILRSIRSDRLARTLTMEVEVSYVCEHHGLPDDAFVLELHGVESARATTWAIWPGPRPELEGEPRAEQTRLVETYQSKWREESVGWADFEARVVGNRFDILNADAARGNDRIGLRLSGQLGGGDGHDQFFEFTVRAGGLIIRHGPVTEMDFARFVKLGEDYWDAWSEGKT